jgi:hypothetical protein
LLIHNASSDEDKSFAFLPRLVHHNTSFEKQGWTFDTVLLRYLS